MLGVEGRKQDRIISKGMVASIEEMQRVLATSWGSDSSVALAAIILQCILRLRSADEVACDFLRCE